MANFLQKLVSKKKRRHVEDGFNLDMTFITPRIVAMGFPSEGREGWYRNKMTDVIRYFDGRYKDHYKVYNLCSERGYAPEKFYGRVANYPFDDHNAPPFVIFKPFCDDVQKYLAEDDRNIALIHCKAGKGRTGVMICAYMLHCKQFTETQESLDFYGNARTQNGKGVTIPSQIRFVHYYGRFLRENLVYKPRTVIMTHIKITGIPTVEHGTCAPFFSIRQGPEQDVTYTSHVFGGLAHQTEVILKLEPPQSICGDAKVEFFHKNKAKNVKMFTFWFNSFFIEHDTLRAPKSEVDKANKDKKNKTYPANFAIEVKFTVPDERLPSDVNEMAEQRMAAKETAAATKVGVAKHASKTSAVEVQAAPGMQAALLPAKDKDDWEGLPITMI
jgi:phosphatidylinositol-3,4,5-trisphosphate 3-phosphatase/dual-specificity protein phosphatase PTEN